MEYNDFDFGDYPEQVYENEEGYQGQNSIENSDGQQYNEFSSKDNDGGSSNEGSSDGEFDDGGSNDGEGVAEFKDRARTSKLVEGMSTVGGKTFFQSKTAIEQFKEDVELVFAKFKTPKDVQRKVIKHAEGMKNIHIYNARIFTLTFMYNNMQDSRLTKENLKKFIKTNNLKDEEHIGEDLIRYIRNLKN